MSVLIEELYDALKEAGASDEKARAASRAVAKYESEIGSIQATQRLHSWMLGTLLALTIAILFRVF
jgi:uncharacterized protein Yka (UPF0111/DUF47 family)